MGKIINREDHNILRFKFKFDDKDKKNNAIFSNKDANDKNDIEIKIDYENFILTDKKINKKNNLKAENGLITFECSITTNLNESF